MSYVVAYIVLVFNLCAVAFSTAMLAWAVSELHHNEEWVGVLYFGMIGLGVELVLMWITVIFGFGASRKLQALLLASILLAILLDAGALGCFFYGPAAS